jgi:hypothetical protein
MLARTTVVLDFLFSWDFELDCQCAGSNSCQRRGSICRFLFDKKRPTSLYLTFRGILHPPVIWLNLIDVLRSRSAILRQEIFNPLPYSICRSSNGWIISGSDDLRHRWAIDLPSVRRCGGRVRHRLGSSFSKKQGPCSQYASARLRRCDCSPSDNTQWQTEEHCGCWPSPGVNSPVEGWMDPYPSRWLLVLYRRL